ncbi:MAG: cytochrome c oxidase assembly protein [Acidimicrobiales bacterium]
MTDGAAPVRPRLWSGGWRTWCLVGAAVVAVAALAPPLATWARRTESVSVLQFSLLALPVPALFVVGAPWRVLRLARRGDCADRRPRVVDRLADHRRRHRELPWSLAFVAIGIAVAIAWHTPRAVAAVAAHGWLAPVEGLTLLLAGTGLWLELVRSPPLEPRSGLLRRAVLAAVSMWAFWILAYVTGLSTHGFYGNFHHAAGGLSAAADEQIASAVLWAVASATFAPVIFWNALRWLQSEEDPDTELLALARADRRRGLPPFGGHRGGAASA